MIVMRNDIENKLVRISAKCFKRQFSFADDADDGT